MMLKTFPTKTARLTLIAVCGLAIVARLIFLFYTDRTWEDALITTLHSENFYNGFGLTHWRIDDPKPLHGFTSPISVLIPLVGDFVHVGWGLVLQKVMSIVAAVVAIVYASLILKETVGRDSLVPAIALAGGYMALEHHQILWGMAGMETTCVTAVLIASMYYLMRRSVVGLGISFALCIYARPDFILWDLVAGTFFVISSWRAGRWRDPFLVAGIALACYVPWLLFTTLYYGSPIPNTVIAKSLGYPIWWSKPKGLDEHLRDAYGILVSRVLAPLGPAFGGNGTGFQDLRGHGWVQVAFVSAVVVSLVTSMIRGEMRKRAPIYCFVGLFLVYQVFAVPVIFGWYLVPLAALCALLAAFAVGDIAARWPRLHYPAVAFSIALLLPFVVVLPTTFRGERNIQRYVETPVRKAIGEYFATLPRDITIGGEPLGYISYYSRRTYYDYPGLCSRRVVNVLRDWQAKCSHCHLFLQVMDAIRPDYLVFRKGEYEAYGAIVEGKFLHTDYSELRWYRVRDEDRSRLLFGDQNIDTDFIVLKKTGS